MNPLPLKHTPLSGATVYSKAVILLLLDYWLFKLNHLSRMYFPKCINWRSPFPILGLFGGIYHFCSNFKIHFCMQTVENLIRRRIFTVCQCPTKKTQGLYELNKVQCVGNRRKNMK